MNTLCEAPRDFCFDWCRSGNTFDRCTVAEVKSFLLNRKINRLHEHSRDLEIVFDDAGAVLRRRSSHFHGYPIRQSFFDKLMRWHQFPLHALHRMTPKEILPLVNGVLRLIGKPVVIYVEDDEALTIVSENYARIADDLLLEIKSPGSLLEVTRTDHFMRVIGEERAQVEVKPGDFVGIQSSIVNSETGFRALSVGWQLMRLVCSNGAVVPLSLQSDKIYHDNSKSIPEQLDVVLERLRRTRSHHREAAQLLLRAVKAKSPARADAERALRPIIGFLDTKRLLDPHYADKSAGFYELFNRVTAAARDKAPGDRLAMEEAAGAWLWQTIDPRWKDGAPQ